MGVRHGRHTGGYTGGTGQICCRRVGQGGRAVLRTPVPAYVRRLFRALQFPRDPVRSPLSFRPVCRLRPRTTSDPRRPHPVPPSLPSAPRAGVAAAQEPSNTAWALATLHSKRDRADAAAAETEAAEDDAIVRVLRWVARDLVERAGSFKPREISNRCARVLFARAVSYAPLWRTTESATRVRSS